MNSSPITQENNEIKEKNIKVLISASIVGGILTSFLVTPLDVVKTRLQTQDKPIISPNNINSNIHQNNKYIFKGTFDAFKKIYKNEGIFTFWRGMNYSIIQIIPNTTIYFTSYEYIKEYLYKFGNSEAYDIYTVPLIAGTLARMVSASVTSPLELLRTNSQGINLKLYKQQQQQSNQPLNQQQNIKSLKQPKFNSIALFRDIVKNVGVLGLWRGYIITILRDAPFSSIYWAGYEVVRTSLMKIKDPNFKSRTQQSPFIINFTAGGISGTIAAILTTPIDVIKTKLQMSVQKQQQEQQYIIKNHQNSVKYQFNQIIKEEGFMGLTRGMVPRIMKVAPGCAIMVSTFQWIQNR